MKAALLEKIRAMSVGDQPDPGLPADHVLVRVATSAICGTDVSIWAGKMPARIPLIPGHECTGTVEQVGESVTRLKIGDRVVLNPLSSCGSCFYCVRGLTNICLNGGLRGREVPGTFAEYIAVRETEAFAFPENVSFAAATNFVGLYTVVYSQRKAPYIAGSRVAVLGQGSSGLLHTQLAKVSGAASVIAVTRSKWKLEVARRMGADEIVPAGEVNPVEAVLELTDGLGADIVIETAGAAETMVQAYEMVRPGRRHPAIRHRAGCGRRGAGPGLLLQGSDRHRLARGPAGGFRAGHPPGGDRANRPGTPRHPPLRAR